MKSTFEKRVYGFMQGDIPMGLSELRLWIDNMESEGATHIVCSSYMSAYKILTDKEVLKEQIDRQEAELNQLKAEYEQQL